MAEQKDEILTKVDKLETYLDPAFKRMDEDFEKRYLLEEYVFADSKGRAYEDVESVTMNDPRTFADRVIWTLGTAKRRFDIQCEEDEVASKAEQFLKFAYTRADENIIAEGQFGMEECFDHSTPLRGSCAVRILVLREGKKYYFDIKAIDPRALIFEPGHKGTEIRAIRGRRSAWDIKAEYGEDIGSDDAVVTDIWTATDNYIYVEDRQIRKVAHGLKMNPIFYVGCPTSPLWSTKQGSVKHRNESIYAPVRHLYDLLNRQSSGWATQNMMQIMAPLGFESKDGRKAKYPPFGLRSVTPYRTGEGYRAIPFKDIPEAFQAFFGQIMLRIQQATMSSVDYGQLSFELSALAIKRLEAARDQVFVPRLKAKRMIMSLASYGLINQFANGGYPLDKALVPEGLKLEEIPFDPKDFKDKQFVIAIDYFSVSPDESIADSTIAQSWLNLQVPEEYVWKHILKIEDYEETIKMRNRERLLKESEAARKYAYGLALLDTGDPDDEILADIALREIGYAVQGGKIVSGGQPLPQLPSQPKPLPGLTTMPIASRPQVAEAKTLREEKRRRRIFETEKGMKAKETE
jgi:hypothetical protein